MQPQSDIDLQRYITERAAIRRNAALARAGKTKPGAKPLTLKFYGNNLKFLESTEHQLILAGPAECVAGETLIYDPLRDCSDRIEDLYRERQAPTVLTLAGPAQAETPFLKGESALYRVTLKSGKSCLVTARHRVLSQTGWAFVADLYVGDAVLSSDACHLPSSSAASPLGSREDVQRLLGIAQDYQDRCSSGRRLYDVAPLLVRADGLTSQPLLNGAHEYPHDYLRQDDPCRAGLEHNRLYQFVARLSSVGYVPCLSAEHKRPVESHAVSRTASRYDDWFRYEWRSLRLGDPRQPSSELDQDYGSKHLDESRLALYRDVLTGYEPADGYSLPSQLLSVRQAFVDKPQELEPVDRWLDGDTPSCSNSPKLYYTAQWDEITSVEYERTDIFYDLHVPGAEHYLADEIWHHNTGKTYAACAKVHRLCMKHPGVQAAIVRKSYADMPGTVLQTFARVAGNAATVYGGEKPQWYDYVNKSRVWIGGLDHPGKVLSSERDLIYVNQAEQLELDDWETLTTRATGRAGNVPTSQVIGDCNPGSPTHWIKTTIPLIESRHEDNPALFDQQTGEITAQGILSLSILDKLTGPRKSRLRYGQWAGAEGMVYEDSWDAKRNLIDWFAPPAHWRRDWVIDFGYTNPFVLQWWAEDDDGRFYLYREIYHTQILVEDHARRAVELSKNEPKPQSVICDHDAEGRATFEKHANVTTVAAKKDVLEGIQAVASRFKPAGDGRARLFIMRGARVDSADRVLADKRKPTCTAEEIEGYVWREKSKKEEPLKQGDHGCDGIRYLVATRDLKARKRIIAAPDISRTSPYTV